MSSRQNDLLSEEQKDYFEGLVLVLWWLYFDWGHVLCGWCSSIGVEDVNKDGLHQKAMERVSVGQRDLCHYFKGSEVRNS